MKTCTKCEAEYEATSMFFHNRKDGKDGLNAQCKKCKNEIRAKSGSNKAYYRRHKGECNARSSEYQKTDKGLESHRKAGRKYNSSLKGKKRVKENHLLRKYGISLKDRDYMYLCQYGCCKLCGEPVSLDNIYVDHDHATGRVRGLLCVGCNTGLGLLGDNIEGLQAALKYLGVEE